VDNQNSYADGVEDISERYISNVCGTYTLNSDNKVVLSQKIDVFIIFADEVLTTKIDNGFGTDILDIKDVNDRISNMRGAFSYNTITANKFTANKNFGDGRNMSFEYDFFKRVYNKEYLFNNLCGGTPASSQTPSRGGGGTSGGGGCSIM
jgi:hypothetical protein